MPEQECIFCGIAEGKIPSKKIYEDDKVIAVLDISPAAPGHVLVIPKQHISIMPQMPKDLVDHLGVVAKKMSHEVIKKLGVEGTSIFIANGAAAGQRAPHFMMHIIPRIEGDGIQLDPPAAAIPEDQMKQVLQQMQSSIDKNFKGIVTEQPKEQSAGNPELDDITNLLAGK